MGDFNGTLLRASSVRSFHDNSEQWYNNHILGEDKFEGNTSTYLGSVVHYFAEIYFSDKEMTMEQIIDEVLSEAGDDIDQEVIRDEAPEMCEVFERDYLSTIEAPDYVELYNYIDDGSIRFQGTCDAIHGGVMVDYKTSKTPVKKIDGYIQQLNIYAFLVSFKDIKIDTLRVVNIARRTKTLPPRVTILECDADVNEGERLVRLMIDKARLALKNPEFAHLIFTPNPYSFISDGFNIETRIVPIIDTTEG